MKVLILGGGGREHALAWKIAKSPLLKKLYCAPGNAGIAAVAECVDIKPEERDRLLQFAKSEKIDLTVVGPEAPLVAGISDLFLREGLPVFGPSKACSRLEGSKLFAKQKMQVFGVPTAKFEAASDHQAARQILHSWDRFPVVVKADGLAAGKGVVIAGSRGEAEETLEHFFVAKKLGEAGSRVVIEEYLTGEELSILVLTDGRKILPLASSQDHKRAYDGDKGPNTGGMGAYSPCPFIDETKMSEIVSKTVTPLIRGLAAERLAYQGLLYAGLMLTSDGPKVLEYNVRFGDPETEAVLPRLKSDLLPVLLECARGELKTTALEWDKRHSVTVVMASQGYPGAFDKGFAVTGLDEAEKTGAVVFHSGTALKDGCVVTSGGRVFAVTALGNGLKEAAEGAYRALDRVHFRNSYYRTDIAKRIYERSVTV